MSLKHRPASRRIPAVFRYVAASLVGLAAQSAAAAGLSATVVPAGGPDGALEVLVWSPCAAPPSDIRMGPYVIRATRDCAVAGRSLPLVVISHGRGGSRLGHHDTATALADAGFIVASFNHPGDSFGDESSSDRLVIFESRPAQVSRVISHMLGQWPQRQLIDASAVGVFGFSRGGYTALALAGAVPSRAASAARYCGAWWSFVVPLCRQLGDSAAGLRVQADPRVTAVVAADPLNLFDAASFRAVKAPVQLWASELGGDGVEPGHAQLIREWLPPGVEFTLAKGAGHFAFLAPCPEALRQEARALCEDPKGFDRAQWHATMNQAVARFFTTNLRKGTP